MGLRAPVCECGQCGTVFRCDLPFAVDLCSMCEASMLRDAAPVDAEECCTWDAWAEACMAERFTTREVV